jgi:hypothetical protein
MTRERSIKDLVDSLETLRYILDGYTDFLTDDELSQMSKSFISIADSTMDLIHMREERLRKEEMGK